jgi:chemosensory pili system protein ChpA (sensor histidine kinase/response regulator)
VSTTRKTAFPDVTTVIAITSEMVSSLNEIIAAFPAFSDSPKTAPISELVQNMTAAASLMNLRVVSVVGDMIVELAEGIEAGKFRGPEAFNAIHTALSALHRYLTIAAGGKISSGVVLHGAYESIASVLGVQKPMSKPDFFIPVSPIYPPSAATFDKKTFVNEVARYHVEFNAEMAAYARAKTVENVHDMRTTLVTLETKNPPPELRVLLSLAICYMDVAIQAGGMIASNDEPLLSVLDKILSAATHGELDVDDSVVSSFLYVVAQASQPTPRLRQFQAIYELDRLFSEETVQINESMLEDAKSVVTDAERAWKNIADEDGSPEAAKAAVFAMASFFSTLGDYALKSMSVSVGTLAEAIVTGRVPRDSEVAIFGASVLIAIDDRLDRIVHEPKGGRTIAEFHKERVRAVVGGTRPSALSNDLPEQQGYSGAIIEEITADVQSAEQIVEQCLRGEISEEKIEEASTLFNSVYCAMSFINMEEASDFVESVSAEVEKSLRALLVGEELSERSKIIITSAVMSLNRYLSLINVDNNQASDALRKGLALFAVTEVVDEVIVSDEDGPTDICTDEDIGPIFYDEAKEVVNLLILPGVAKLRANPNDDKMFLDVRRGFHTLKGSARMVELTNLGMIGQYIEFSLNLLRDDKTYKMSNELLDWLEASAKFFSTAIAILEENKPAPANPEPFKLIYENFRDTKVFQRKVGSAPVVVPEKAVDERRATVAEPVAAIDEAARKAAEQEAALAEAHRAKVFAEAALAEEADRLAAEKAEAGRVEAEAMAAAQAEAEAEAMAAAQAAEAALHVEEERQRIAHAASLTREAEEKRAEIEREEALRVAEAIRAEQESVLEAARAEAAYLAAEEARLEEGRREAKRIEVARVAEEQRIAQEVRAAELARVEEARNLKAKKAEQEQAEKVRQAAELQRVEEERVAAEVAAIPDSERMVRIGSVELAPALYEAFVQEARSFCVAMEKHLNAVIAGNERMIGFEFMRLAHSLAGMGRTCNFPHMADLAASFETWSALNQDRHMSLDGRTSRVLREAMMLLTSMAAGIERKVEPKSARDILAKMAEVIAISEHRDSNRDAVDVVSESVMKASKNRSEIKLGSDMEQIVNAADRLRRSSEEEIASETTELVSAADVESYEGKVQAGGAMGLGNIAAEIREATVLEANEAEEIVESVHESVVMTHADDPVVESIVVATSTKGVKATEAIRNITATFGKAMGVDWIGIIENKSDDIDMDMLEIFLEEADERFGEIDECIAALAQDITNKKQTNTLKRAVHTLKGSANTTGARKVGAIFHYLEDLMDANNVLTSVLVATVQAGVDASYAAVGAMKESKSVDRAVARTMQKTDGESSTTSTSENVISALEITQSSDQTTGSMVDKVQESSVTHHATAVQSLSLDTTMQEDERGYGDTAERRQADRKQSDKRQAEKEDELRVSSRVLDAIGKLVGEVNISRSRVGLNIGLCKTSLAGAGISLSRLSGLLRQIELEAEKQMHTGNSNVGISDAFDSLQMDRFTRLQELTRRVAEAQNDLTIQQITTVTAIRDMEDAVASQDVLMGALSGDLDQIRQVRVSSIVPTLRRVVRAACRDTGKQGEIFFDADVEIDRGILDKTGDALSHILRNAVAHGLETPVEREAVGKDSVGAIEFRAYQDGGDVVIEVRDDGRGIDTQKVLARAIERGLVKATDNLSEDKIRDLLFEPGFSTADSVSDIAGRGVGLDVVRSDIAAMGGRVQLTSTFGSGTSFVLRVPASLSVISGAAVKTNGHMYVVPVAFIDRLVRISAAEMKDAYKNQRLSVPDAAGNMVDYEFWGMWEIVGAGSNETAPNPRNSVILMNGDRVAIHVDDMRPAEDFVFRALGPQISATTGLIGSTISAAGNASIVVDATRVARVLRSARDSGKALVKKEEKKATTVLIVDDSLTVRTVTSRLLKKNGFRVMMAEHGMQALERINEERPDVILMDIEMPVMNGYDATQAIRATQGMKDIPIIMITSRSGDSHRARAFELGVNAYLGKPYNDNELLSEIEKFAALSDVVPA